MLGVDTATSDTDITITIPIRIKTLYCLLDTIDNISFDGSFSWVWNRVCYNNNSTITHHGYFKQYNPNSIGRWIFIISN